LLDRKLPNPNIFLEQIVNEEEVIENPKTFSTLYTGQRIEFQFTSPSFSQNKNLRFRYRLKGYDEDWVNAGNNRVAVYTKIPPGDYSFEVMVGYQNDFSTDQILSIPVEIVPPFYMNRWFIGVSILLFLGLVIWGTERRRKNAIRRASQQGALMKVIPDLMLRLDKEGRYLEYLAGDPIELLVPFDEMKGKEPEDIIPDLAPKMREQMKLATETGKIQKLVYKLTFSQGQTRIYEWRLVSVRKGEEYLLIIRNITRQAKTQRKLKQNQTSLNEALTQKTNLLQKLTETENARLTAFMDAQETERHRISQDLHDSIGQLISSVKIQMGNLEQEIEPRVKSKESLHQIISVLDKVTQEIRNISFNLLPASFTQFGLIAALNDLLNGIRQTAKLDVRLYHNTDLQEIPIRNQLYLFRIIQEAVNNILKHSDATETDVQIINHDDILVVEISDNGQGFNPQEQIKKTGSSGLKNMYARAQVLGGTINIESGSGGTSVFITIPRGNNEAIN